MVTPQDIDELNHVNNLVFLQWCLDAAQSHWTAKTSLSQQQKYSWVVIEHSISYKAAAFLNQELILQTWVEKSEGVKSERHYHIMRKSDNKTLIHAKTLWCLVDSNTQRPLKIPEEITNLFVIK